MLAASDVWFLENAWLIPVVPGLAAVAILFFGRKAGRLLGGGSYLAIGSMTVSLVLSLGAAYQWITRVDDAEGGEGAVAALGAAGRAMGLRLAEGEEGAFVGPVIRQWTWWQSGGQKFTIGTQVDGLAVTLMVVVAFISLLVYVYSLEYMRGDRRYTHFYFAITLFSAGMLLMVVAESTVQLLLGWELMGVTSFLLIGHWWEEYGNARSALKAFLTVRIGDMGMLLGVPVLFWSSNQWVQGNLDGLDGFSIAGINTWALSGEASQGALTAAAGLLLIGAIGKSAQFPLHTWLPDAMAGPTPVSSLLHSSTMVVAGIYLVARLFPVFFQGFDILGTNVNGIVVIAGITIIISGLLALVQVDIKRVLAYSSVGQLGYMLLGLGAGAWLPAVFHIFTHAFFKASLFLSAGSVSHSGSHHSFDMKRDMGGLRKSMPVTFVSWIICTLALAGVFPLSGFFSKDEIIDNVGHNGYVVFQWLALAGAFLTAAYMARATYLTFFGQPRGAAAGEDTHVDVHDEAELGTALHESQVPAPADDDAHGGGHDAPDDGHGAHARPHESGWLLLGPIVALTVCAVFAGFLNATPFGIEKFKEYVEPVGVEATYEEAADVGGPGASAARAEDEAAESGCGFEDPSQGSACAFPALPHAEFEWSKALVSLAIVFAGLGIGFAVSRALYTTRSPGLFRLTDRSPIAHAGYTFLENKYYLDDLYEKGVVGAVSGPVARSANWANQEVIDAVVDGTGRTTVAVGRFTNRYVDVGIVDRAVNETGDAAGETGKALQPLQSGKVAQYAAWLFGAAAVGALILVLAV